MSLVADHELVRAAGDVACVAGEPRIRLDRDRVVPERLLALVDRLGEAIGVPLGRQVALELRDEQSAMGEDQDAEVPCGFDEPGGGNRLTRRGRVAEAVAPRGARVVAAEHALVGLVVDDPRVDVVVLVVEVGRLAVDRLGAVPVPVLLGITLIRRDQLGQHAGERVNLVAPELRPGRRGGGRSGEHTLEAQHEAVANAPPRRGRATTGVHFGDGVVERTASRGARRQRGGRVLTGVQERLAVPGLSAERGGFQALRRLRRRMCRVEVGSCICAAHDWSAAFLEEQHTYAFPARRAVLRVAL